MLCYHETVAGNVGPAIAAHLEHNDGVEYIAVRIGGQAPKANGAGRLHTKPESVQEVGDPWQAVQRLQPI